VEPDSARLVLLDHLVPGSPHRTTTGVPIVLCGPVADRSLPRVIKRHPGGETAGQFVVGKEQETR